MLTRKGAQAEALDPDLGETKEKYVPRHLKRDRVAPGEWMDVGKLPVYAMARPNQTLKVRIWSLLILRTAGYENSVAVKERLVTKRKDAPEHVTPLQSHDLVLLLNAATRGACKESKVHLPEEQLKAVLATKARVRRALESMENDEGLICRARWNRQPDSRAYCELAGVSLHDAIARGYVTPLSSLSEAQKRRAGKVVIYLLQQPKPAKNIQQSIDESIARSEAQRGTVDVPLWDDKSIEISESTQHISPSLEPADHPGAQYLLPFLDPADRILAPVIAAHPDFAAALQAFVRARAELQQTVNRLVGLQHEAAQGHPPALQPAGSSPTPSPAASPNRKSTATGRQSDTAGAAERDRITHPAPTPRPSAAVNPQRAESPLVTTSGEADAPRASASSTAAGSPVEVSIVQATMRTYCHPVHVEQDMARGLLIACRNRAPSCRIETVVDMIHRKGAMMREFGPGNRDMGLNLQRYSNPVAFLRVAVPKMFDGDDWKQIEDKERRRQEDLIARARAVLANESDYDEMDRLRAREILREAGLT